MILIKDFHHQQRIMYIYYLDAGHPLDRALLLLLRRPLPALNLRYNHDGDDEDDDDDRSDYDGDDDDDNNDDTPG